MNFEEEVNNFSSFQEDLNSDTLTKFRELIPQRWKGYNNPDLFKRLSLISTESSDNKNDFRFKNAAILLFGSSVGKDGLNNGSNSVSKIISCHVTNVILRISDDVRNNNYKRIEGNLLDSYYEIMEFCYHQICNLNNNSNNEVVEEILRELITNTLLHRDYYSHDIFEVLIERDKITMENPTVLFYFGRIDENSSYIKSKNPLITRVFRGLRLTDSICSVMRIYPCIVLYSNDLE